MTSTERFWTRVKKTENCWLWTSYIAGHGYGKWGSSRDKKEYAHRVAYRLLVGEIPVGMTLDHLCRVRHCVNPKHLEPVTRGENARRGIQYKMEVRQNVST